MIFTVQKAVENHMPEVIVIDVFGFGFIADNDAMAEHVHADGLHVLRGDVPASLQERVGFRGNVQID